MSELYEHQQRILREDPKKSLIALGTGGGKTRVCLELASGKTLVVCPKQQKLDQTWERNADKFGLVVNLTVVSKEEFRRDAAVLGRFDTVIFDECHTILGVTPDTRSRRGIRTPKASQLFEAAFGFIRRTGPERLYLASATPVTKPMHAWAISTLFGNNWDFFRFREKYYVEKKKGLRTIWLPRNSNDLRSRLADITRGFGYTGQLSDWFDVPEQRHETIYVKLTDDQQRRIDQLEREEADPLAKRAKLRTVENGILYTTDVVSESAGVDRLQKGTEFFSNAKLEEIAGIVRSQGKVLIFAAFTGQIEQIRSFLLGIEIHDKERLEGVRSGGDRLGQGEPTPKRNIFTLTGQTKDRGTVIQEAEKSERAVVIAQGSISAGYELPSFSHVIFASKSYRYVDYEQALGRVLRANAIKENTYYHLVVKGGVDEACHKAILSGQDFQEKLMENL